MLLIKRLGEKQFKATEVLARSLGNKIADILKQQNITQAAFSQYSGITNSELHRWMKGYGTPSLKRLVRISLLLDISVADLVTLTEEENEIYRSYNREDNSESIRQ